MNAERNLEPGRDTPQYRDYERVNALLERVEGEVKATLLASIVEDVDRKLGRVGLSSKGLLAPVL